MNGQSLPATLGAASTMRSAAFAGKPGGQRVAKQRVRPLGLARAVGRDPPCRIADIPDEGLSHACLLDSFWCHGTWIHVPQRRYHLA